MLSQDQIKHFFHENHLCLAEERILKESEFQTLILNANVCGLAMVAFVLEGLLEHPSSRTIATNFDSWEELYDCYTGFMTGYLISDNGKDN